MRFVVIALSLFVLLSLILTFHYRYYQFSDDEFQVSSSAPFAQWVTHIAAAPNGTSVVAWQNNLQDGSGWGIYARRYDALGVPQGNEFPVNTEIAENQFVPRVAIDANGNFVIVWESKNQDGDGYGIYCQRYNSAGVRLGNEFRVNTTTLNSQNDPFIAMATNGNFVVVWVSDSQDGSMEGVFGQYFNAAGVPEGGEFQVNTYTNGIQKQPSIGMDTKGNFVVVWESDGQDSSGKGIYGQRYSADGVPAGSEFQVNTYTPNDQSGASVAVNPNGDFIVAWGSTGQDGSDVGVFAQRYDAAGIQQGGEFQVNKFTEADQIYPSVAIAPSSDFVIVWDSQSQDGSGNGVYGQRYDSDGVPEGDEFQVNTYTRNKQFGPFIANDATGNFIVAWTSFGQDESVEGVYGKRFDTAGNALKTP